MILYSKDKMTNIRTRPIKTLNMSIDEPPTRPTYPLVSTRERGKFIMTIEGIIRKSPEYKDYIKFLKTHMDMARCTVLKGLSTENGRKYTIEIHHEPFSLFSITDTVIRKREALNEEINPYLIAEEVMGLHYDEKVGLIPLSKTMHELVESGKVYVPLQYIYQSYEKFYDEYESWMDDKVKTAIEGKVALSLKSGDILSDVLDPEFVYINIDGFNFPEIPSEWGSIFKDAQHAEE